MKDFETQKEPWKLVIVVAIIWFWDHTQRYSRVTSIFALRNHSDGVRWKMGCLWSILAPRKLLKLQNSRPKLYINPREALIEFQEQKSLNQNNNINCSKLSLMTIIPATDYPQNISPIFGLPASLPETYNSFTYMVFISPHRSYGNSSTALLGIYTWITPFWRSPHCLVSPYIYQILWHFLSLSSYFPNKFSFFSLFISFLKLLYAMLGNGSWMRQRIISLFLQRIIFTLTWDHNIWKISRNWKFSHHEDQVELGYDWTTAIWIWWKTSTMHLCTDLFFNRGFLSVLYLVGTSIWVRRKKYRLPSWSYFLLPINHPQ